MRQSLSGFVNRLFRASLLALAIYLLGATRLQAQGGPPYFTNDPGRQLRRERHLDAFVVLQLERVATTFEIERATREAIGNRIGHPVVAPGVMGDEHHDLVVDLRELDVVLAIDGPEG